MNYLQHKSYSLAKGLLPSIFPALIFSLLILQACHSGKGERDTFIITSYSSKSLDSLQKALNEEIKDNPKEAAPYYHRAQLDIAMRDTGNAMEDMELALKRDSSRVDYYLYYGNILEKHAIITKAVKVYQKILSLDPKNTFAMVALGRIYYYIQNHDESIKYLNQAITLDNHIAEAYYLRGMNFKEMNFTDNAIKSFQTAVAVNQAYYEAYMQLGAMFAKQKKPMAAAYYENAIRINPADPRAFFARGSYFQEVDSTRLAIRDYTEAVRKDPNFKQAHYNLAYNLYLDKKYQKAMEHFSDALKLDSTFIIAQDGIDSCKMKMRGK